MNFVIEVAPQLEPPTDQDDHVNLTNATSLSKSKSLPNLNAKPSYESSKESQAETEKEIQRLFSSQRFVPVTDKFWARRNSRQYNSEPNRAEKRGRCCGYDPLLDSFPNRLGDPNNAIVARHLMLNARTKGRQFNTSLNTKRNV